MKEKMFSLFLVVTLFLTSFNPVFALGSEINGNDENSTQEDLPIVTEKVPEDSAKDKYVKILFVPETNLINNVQNYGTIKNENNEEVALRDEVYNGETTKAKAFYALKSAKWSDLINYRENGKKIFLKLWVENKDKNSEDHKFLGWTNNKILIDVLNPDFLGGKELGKFEVSTRTRYDMENPIVFKAYFQSLPYVYTTADHAVPRRDADGYTLYTSNYKHCTFKYSDPKGTTFNPTEFQKRYFITNPYNLKDVVFYIRNDIKDRSFGKFKPNINLAKDAMFCYWYRDPKVDTKLTDDYQILHFENFDLDNYFAKLIINGESISKNSVEQRNFPEDICVVNLVKGKGNKDNVFNYGNYLVFKESKISVIENNKSFKLPTFNKSSNLHWYCDGKKIDDIRDITVNKDMTFVARVENDSEKYTINALDLEKNYGSEIKENEIINCITTNYPKNSDSKPIISLEKGQTLPDGKKSGEYNIKIEVKYPDESISKTSVKLTVLKSQAETYREETKTLEVNKNKVLTVEKLKEGITNLPQEVKVDIKEDADTSEVGEKTARLTLTFKDSSSKEVSIKVRVKEVIEGGIIRPIPEIRKEDIEKEEVTYSGNINLTDNIKNLPEGSVVEDITDPKIDTRKPGEYSGKVKVTFKDGSSRIVIVPVEVLKSQAETYREETKTLEVNKNKVLTVEKLKEGITNLPQEVKVDIKEDADTSEVGEKTARLTLTFKDSSSKEVEVKLRVKEIIPVKSDSEKNPPIIPKDLKVVDKNKLSQAEIDEIARKFKLANPKAKDVIVDQEGNLTLIYEDDSKNILKLANYLTEDPKENREKDKDNDGKGNKENKDKKENWDNYYPDYYNYFPDLNKSDGERNTFKVFVSLPEKVKEEKKAYENTSYVFHINDFYYEIIKDGLSRKINMDIAPIINNGRTMLPLRKVAEVLGAKVIWNKDTRTAFFKRSGQTASIQIDNNKIILSSGEVIEMEAKPLNIQDRIFVSLVNVAKVFGLNNGNKDDGKDNDIEWDNEASTVTIYVK